MQNIVEIIVIIADTINDSIYLKQVNLLNS